jgi:uncharacterized protein with ParB-like and HNH nuclease domain
MEITPKSTTLEGLFTGIETRYAVPHYQRDYSWKTEHCEQVWVDVIAAWTKRSEYFLGSIVLNSENRGATGKWEIVDGQQRLATFAILLSAVRDLAKKYLDEPGNEAFSNINQLNPEARNKAIRAESKARQLIVHVSEPDNYYLELNEKDHPQFREKVQLEQDAMLTKADWKIGKTDRRTVKAKKTFARLLRGEFLRDTNAMQRLDDFVSFVMTKLIFLRIDVTNDADAYLLFETLNDRGLDLSIADLVKNRLMVEARQDGEKKKRILIRWDQMIKDLAQSRYLTHDFLRFYWAAFQSTCTKKELYAKIKAHIAQNDPEQLVSDMASVAEYFSETTSRDLIYPSGGFQPESVERIYAEINTLGYSVCYPLFLHWWKKRDRSELLPLSQGSVNFLFRLISIGTFAARNAEEAFAQALIAAKQQKSLNDVLKCFAHKEVQDGVFAQRIKGLRFNDNKTARYLLSKVHDSEHGSGHALTSDVHLEHVMPVDGSKWPEFDCRGRDRKDWLYCIGNMTLLEKRLNQSLQASPFSEKVRRFQRKTPQTSFSESTAVPMTYRIHEEHESSGRDWNAEWIEERAGTFANRAVQVWELPPSARLVDPPPPDDDEAQESNETSEAPQI